MCGIVGIVYKDRGRKVPEAEVIGMRDLLVHRGPDDQGVFIDGNAGLGHRRLSIIDLESGRQPMTNEDETLWIVFNGEIYNFMELREDLLQRGHVFRTRSDTEVILHLYEEKGEACAAELNGIFAFAIWDKKAKSLFLARDHMGIKPLYYAETKDAFLFSSEIKSIVQSGRLEARCDREAAAEYFLFRHVSGENTLFQGVKSLLPAATLLLENGRIQTKAYWTPFPEDDRKCASFEATVDELSWLIRDSVKRQMISDVPLGTFCSGGVDSSLVTAIAAGFAGAPINTFSVGFHEDGYDETSYARMVSKQYATRHHEIRLTNQEFADLLPKMIWHNDEPLNFANSIQIYAISKLARENVTVVLTGEGADELFGGYPRYHIPKLAAYYRSTPQFLTKILWAAFGSAGGHRFDKINRFADYSEKETLLFNSGFLDRDFFGKIVPGLRLPELTYRKDNLAKTENPGFDRVNRLSLLDQQNYLVSILNRQDKMSMAASIESRVPLLDYRIVELANRMPSHYKMKFLKTKMVLKHVARDYLPPKIIDRKKSGFGVPLGMWFREPAGMAKWLEEIAGELPNCDMIDREQFTKIVKEHEQGSKDHSEILWTACKFFALEEGFFSFRCVI